MKDARKLLAELVQALERLEKCHTCMHPIGNESACDRHRIPLEAAFGEARAFLAKPQSN